MKKGFTLIELMVVVLIIGVLAALAIPKFLTTTDRAKLSEWKVITKQLVVLQNNYRQYHDVWFTSSLWKYYPSTGQVVITGGAQAKSSEFGFFHPSGDSRFSYGVDVSGDVDDNQPNLAYALLEVDLGEYKINDKGAMNQVGEISEGASYKLK